MRIARLATLLAACLLAFAAWAEEAPLYKLVARDGRFEPAVLEVRAGQRFRLEVSNAGTKAIEFESKDLKQEKIIAAGKKVIVTINALKPGEYKFFDEFQQATATGKLVAK